MKANETLEEMQLPWFLQEYTDAYTNIIRPADAPGQIICQSSSGPNRRKQMEFIIDACNQHAANKPHGGKRKGAGRPVTKEPTVVMRIPLSKVEAVKKLIRHGRK